MRPETCALLDATAEVTHLHGVDPLPPQPDGDPEMVRALSRLGQALARWIWAGGPDRGDAEHGPALCRAWELRTQRRVRQAVKALEAERAKSLGRLIRRAQAGLPRWAGEMLDDLPAHTLAELGATEERLMTSGALSALCARLKDVDTLALDPMAMAIGGFEMNRVPGWEHQLLSLVQATGRAEASVHVKMWSWVGCVLDALMERRDGVLWSSVEPAETGSCSLRLSGTGGEVAFLNLYFPELDPGPGPAIAEALCRVIAVLLNAPAVEVA